MNLSKQFYYYFKHFSNPCSNTDFLNWNFSYRDGFGGLQGAARTPWEPPVDMVRKNIFDFWFLFCIYFQNTFLLVTNK